MKNQRSSLEIRNRRGDVVLRAEGQMAIYAVVSLRLIRWLGILLLVWHGVPFVP